MAMRNVMRTLTGLLALLLVGATTATAGVGSTVDSTGAVETDHAAAAYDASASATADENGATVDANAGAAAMADLPDVDVDAAKSDAETKADAAAAMVETTVSETEATTRPHVDGGASAAGNAAASVEGTGSEASADLSGSAEADVEAAVEDGFSLFGWLRERIDAVVERVRTLVSVEETLSTGVPDVDASVGGSADAVADLGGSTLGGGLDAAGSVTGDKVGAHGATSAVGDLALPGTPKLPTIP